MKQFLIALGMVGLVGMATQHGRSKTWEELGKEVKAVFDQSYISGSWSLKCVDVKPFDIEKIQAGSLRKNVAFYPNGRFIAEEQYFAKPGCNEIALTYYIRGMVDHLAKSNATQDGQELREIDVVVDSRFVSVESKVLADAFNVVKMCGISDWSAGREFNISDRECLGMKPSQRIQDLFLVKNNGIELSFGQNRLLSIVPFPEQRPDRIKDNVVFKREIPFTH